MNHGKIEIELDRKQWETRRAGRRKLCCWAVVILVLGEVAWILLKP
jgi:hypothetical protein